MYGSLDVSVSGMVAQRTRLAVISSNIAHANTVLDAQGNINPYKRREIMFAPGDPSAKNPHARALGVHVKAIEANPDAVKLKWDPDNRLAYRDGPMRGYVPTPDIDPTLERVNAMEASRAYEANVAAADVTKQMMAQALRLLG